LRSCTGERRYGFWGALCATTEVFFITDAHEDDVFPNDFFLDIDNLFGDMSLTDDNTNGGSASASAPTPYVFLIVVFVLQFLGLAIDLDMLDMVCSYHSLVNMVSLISMFSVMFCSLFSWIKSSVKLLIFPTICYFFFVFVGVFYLWSENTTHVNPYTIQNLLNYIVVFGMFFKKMNNFLGFMISRTLFTCPEC
jgi:hypothetical protein